MKKTLTIGVVLILALAGVAAEEDPRSGPQVSEDLPGPFEPLNVTGEYAGSTHCLYCQNGLHPVAMIFARSVSPELVTLIKKIDAATDMNKACKMGSFVVFLNDDKKLPEQLKDIAKKEGIKHTVLSIDKPAGPEGYNVAKDVDVTVVLYKDVKVMANSAFKKATLKDGDIQKILSDLPKITK